MSILRTPEACQEISRGLSERERRRFDWWAKSRIAIFIRSLMLSERFWARRVDFSIVLIFFACLPVAAVALRLSLIACMLSFVAC